MILLGEKIHSILPELYENMDKRSIKSTERDAEQVEEETNCGARVLAFLYVVDKKGFKLAKYI